MYRTQVDLPHNALTHSAPIDNVIGRPLASAFGTEITGIENMDQLYDLFAIQGAFLLKNAGVEDPFDNQSRLAHVFRVHTRESMIRGIADEDGVKLLPMRARIIVPYTSQYAHDHDQERELETGLPHRMTFGIVRPVKRGKTLVMRAAKTTLNALTDGHLRTDPLVVRKDTQQLGREMTKEQVETYLRQSKRSSVRSALLIAQAR